MIKLLLSTVCLLSLCVGVTACSQEKPTRSTRLDASAVLKHPQVIGEIRAYIQRNPHSQKELYYLDAVRQGQNTHIELSSLFTQSQVIALQPCAFIQLDQEWVLVKTGDCPLVKNIDSLLNQYAPGKIYDDTRRRYKIDAQGDTLWLHDNIFYDPEVVRIELYRDTVTAIHRNLQ